MWLRQRSSSIPSGRRCTKWPQTKHCSSSVSTLQEGNSHSNRTTHSIKKGCQVVLSGKMARSSCSPYPCKRECFQNRIHCSQPRTNRWMSQKH